ncbi:MAG: archaemetzincin family Zn-dependent metalloprotease [Terriglobales bacterium]
MKLLHLLPIGDIDGRLLEDLGPRLSQRFAVPWDIVPAAIDPQFAYHVERQQYHSTDLLGKAQDYVRDNCWRLLGVTELDLYIPILTFVFGEAQMGGAAAVVSTYRLRQEFYGLPPDNALLHERLLKESVHEVGHTLDLRHCEDYRCAMAPSHAVEWIDLKQAVLCPSCESRALPQPKKARAWWF